MRNTLGPLLLLPLLLAGCGGEGSGSATDDASASPSTPGSTAPDPGAAEPVVLALVHETNAGGTVSGELTPIGGDGLLDFLMQFDSSGLSEQVMAVAEANAPAEGRELTAAVVAIGCDVPPGVSVTQPDGAEQGWTVTPDKVTEPLQECLAPVTTVAVVDVPSQA